MFDAFIRTSGALISLVLISTAYGMAFVWPNNDAFLGSPWVNIRRYVEDWQVGFVMLLLTAITVLYGIRHRWWFLAKAVFWLFWASAVLATRNISPAGFVPIAVSLMCVVAYLQVPIIDNRKRAVKIVHSLSEELHASGDE
jgi:hypothetical protein